VAASRRVLAGAALLLALGFAGLGVWQVQRFQWKTGLIARVEAAAAAPPMAAPPPGAVDQAREAYRAVRVSGVFRHDRETLVQAVTVLGPGFWVLTPLSADGGFTVLVNRGFVPTDVARTRAWDRPGGARSVTGLLRATEPHGGFLRANDPAHDRWRSRDVAAILSARGVAGPVAAYFIDEGPNGLEWPRSGMTRLRFSNSHLVYALTWFALAGMALVAAWRVLSDPPDARGQEVSTP
jgi:surfeit locus 1 family protein